MVDDITRGEKPENTWYPRVLIFWMSPIYEADQGGLLIRNLFAEWPRENLAQLHSGQPINGEMYCDYAYGLSPSERRLGRLFFRIKHSSLGESARPLALRQDEISVSKVKRLAIYRNAFSTFLLSTGLWELIFYPSLSLQLAQWVEQFKPEVLYVPGYTLSFSWLPMMISRRFQIPIMFHPTDDWPNALYKHVPIIHNIVLRTAKQLIREFYGTHSFLTAYGGSLSKTVWRPI